MNDKDWQARATDLVLSLRGKTGERGNAILAFAKEYAAEALAEVDRLNRASQAAQSVTCELIGKIKSQFETLADLRAQLAAAGPAWQPVETAPKDGTGFIGWDDDLEHRVFVRWAHGRWALVDQEHFSPCRLTLWAALPTPPKENG